MTERRVRLTGTGLGAAFVCAALLAWGWWARYPELAMTGAVGGAAVVAALGQAALLSPVPVLSRQRLDAGVGDKLEVRLLAPHSARPAGPWHLTDRVVRPVASAGPGDCLAVLPRGAVGYLLVAERRGEHVFGPCTVSWSDPLGLVRAEQVHKETVTTWVRPRIHDSVRLGSGRARTPGQAPSDSHTPGDAFYGLRDYQPGDDVRLVDWRATARHAGQLIVRQYAAPDPVPAVLPHMVVLDVETSSYPGRGGESAFEDAVEIAASLCAAGARSGQPVICATTGQRDAPLEDGLDAILDRLARAVRITGEPPWRHETRVDALTVVTGTAGPAASAWLASVGDLPEVTMVRVGIRGGDPGDPVSAPGDEGAFLIAVESAAMFAPRWNSRELGR